MKKTSILIFLLFFFPNFSIAGTREVEGAASGKYYNKLLEAWHICPITVYVNDEGATYIEGGEGLLIAKVRLIDEGRQNIVNALKNSVEWVGVAKKEHLEVSKEMFKALDIRLDFFSANKGQQTDVILSINEDAIKRISLYLNPEQVLSLIALLEKAPQTLKELQVENKRAEKLLVDNHPQQEHIVNTKDLKLIGISWSNDPDVMIEDTAIHKTYFCKRGAMIGEYQVETINKSDVILKKGDLIFELKEKQLNLE